MPGDAPGQAEAEAAAPSKSALKKAAKEAEKAKKKAETAARVAMQKLSLQEAESVDHSEGMYGTLPLIQSTSRTGSPLSICPLVEAVLIVGEERTRIEEITAAMDRQNVLLRARVQNLRLQGTDASGDGWANRRF